MENLLDYLVLLAFVMLIIDIIFQIKKVKEKHESRDVSISGAVIRLISSFIFLIKFKLLDDWFLTIGQFIFVLVFLCYMGLLLHYKRKRKTKKK